MRAHPVYSRIAAAVLLVGIAACGRGSSPSGLEGRTADQIFDDAMAATERQGSLHVTSTVRVEGTTVVAESLVTADAARRTTTSPQEGVWVDLVVGGAGYVNAHGGGWLKVPADQMRQPQWQMTLHAMVACLRLDHGALSKGPPSTVNGRRVIAVVDDGKAPGATPSTWYVALDGAPLLVRATATGPTAAGGSGCGGAIPAGATVSGDFDYPSGTVTITPPPSLSATPGTAPAQSSTSGAASAGPHGVAEALELVRHIYDPYAGAGVDTPLVSACLSPTSGLCPDALRGAISPDLMSRLQEAARIGDIDPVICAQNVPVSVAYEPPSITAHTATLLVHTYYSASGDNPIRVSVDLDRLQLTEVVCLNAGK